MYRRIAALLLCLGALFPAVSAFAESSANDGGRTFFDLKNTPVIIDRLANPDKALSPDSKTIQKWWNAADSRYSPTQDCYSVHRGLEHSLEHAGITIWLRLVADKGSECQNIPARANLVLDFRDTTTLLRFRTMLEKRFGTADASCSDARIAYWHIAKGASLRWITDENEVELELLASEPYDAACKINSVPDQKPFDQSALTALIKRLKTDPPPWNDQEKLMQWLAALGQVSIKHKERCIESLHVKPFHSGLTLDAWSVNNCTEEDLTLLSKAPVVVDPTHSGIMFFFEKWLKFPEADFERKMYEFYGNPSYCSKDNVKLWVIFEETYIALHKENRGAFFVVQTHPDLKNTCQRSPEK